MSEPKRQELAVGGCGILYLSETAEGKQVEKYLLPKYQRKAEFEQLQQQEYELLSKLRHPGIVQVRRLDLRPSVVGGETSVVVLEYVDGLSLSELESYLDSLNKNERSIWTRSFSSQLLSILQYLRHEGVVHGDLSPENLLITESGRLKLIDFAVARTGDQAPSKKLFVAGNQGFRSPESKNSGSSDFKDDLYSAAKLVEFVAGRELITEPTFSDLHQSLVGGSLDGSRSLGLSKDWYSNLSFPTDPRSVASRVIRRTSIRARSHLKDSLKAAAMAGFWVVLSSPQLYSFLSVATLPPADLQLRSGSDLIERTSPLDEAVLSSGTYGLYINVFQGRDVYYRELELSAFEDLKISEDFRRQ